MRQILSLAALLVITASLAPAPAAAQYQNRGQVPRFNRDRADIPGDRIQAEGAECRQAHSNAIDRLETQIKAHDAEIERQKATVDAIERRFQKAEEDLPQRFGPDQADRYEAARDALSSSMQAQVEAITARIDTLSQEIDQMRDKIRDEEAAKEACG